MIPQRLLGTLLLYKWMCSGLVFCWIFLINFCTDEQPLLEDYDDTAPASWEFYQVGRAEYKPFHERIQEEDKIYFAPSVRAGIYVDPYSLFIIQPGL